MRVWSFVGAVAAWAGVRRTPVPISGQAWALIPSQDIKLEAWIAIAAVAVIFSLFVLVPLGIMIVQSPKLLRDRHYGLFALITFIWSFSIFTLGWMTIPMLVAIWTPYPTHP